MYRIYQKCQFEKYLVCIAKAAVESRSSDRSDKIHAIPHERWRIEEFVISWNGNRQTGWIELG